MPKCELRGGSRSIWIVAILLLSVSACGKSGPNLGTVSGTVKLDGKPLPAATVGFYPKDGRPGQAVTDDQGRYELQYTADAKGAVVGENTVRIQTGVQEGEGANTQAKVKKLPVKYNDQSEVVVNVKSGANTFNFDLESEKKANP